MLLFGFGWRDVSDGFQKTPVVEPVDPFQGGEGPTGQSRWFLIGACVMSDDEDKHVPTWKREILELFPKRRSVDIHFRDFNHDQKVQLALTLGQKPIGIRVVASNKVTLLDHPKREIFKEKQHLYNYLTRFLLERLTDACSAKAIAMGVSEAELRVVFSRRRGTDYQQMRGYLELMRDGHEKLRPIRSIDWKVLDPANDRKVGQDAAVATVGIIIFWPALFFTSGDGMATAEVARLKGEMDAVQSASTAKGCGIVFAKEPPKPKPQKASNPKQ